MGVRSRGPGARKKLQDWEDRKDREHWRPVWVVREDATPWPVFVRIGGENNQEETGIRELSFTEVLEWDPDLDVKPEAGKPATYPRVIIAAPEAKPGLFSQPKIKF